MVKNTKQIKKWMDQFGDNYTDRNALTLEKMNLLYKKNYGLSRTKLNKIFLRNLDRSIKILEVGSNIGNQLLCLQKMGFKNLYGIEINSYAVEFSKSRTKNINIIQVSAFDIPFKDLYFDLVFTSGLLIHIAPSDVYIVLQEIHRCTRKYIWGFEYYADKHIEITYREEKNMLWKANFPKLYLDSFNDLKLVRERRLKYLDNDNIDIMFLLKKKCN